MALSVKAKKRLEVAMARRAEAQEVIAAIESGSNPQAASVAALGVTSNMSALAVTAAVITDSAGTYALPAEPTGAEVDTAINALRDKVETALDLKADNADAETLRTQAEARIDAVEAKIDAVIAALKTAGLMAT
jgi:hypothetical protein